MIIIFCNNRFSTLTSPALENYRIWFSLTNRLWLNLDPNCQKRRQLYLRPSIYPVHCTGVGDGAMNFMGIRILLANSCTRWRGTFKGLSQDGGHTDFSENLRPSLFNDVLSNESTFSHILLAGQCLKCTNAVWWVSGGGGPEP